MAKLALASTPVPGKDRTYQKVADVFAHLVDITGVWETRPISPLPVLGTEPAPTRSVGGNGIEAEEEALYCPKLKSKHKHVCKKDGKALLAHIALQYQLLL